MEHQVSCFRTYQRAGGLAAALGATSTRVRLLQTQLYKMHFYRQENNLNTGVAHSTETELRLTLAGTAMRTKGSSKNTGKERKTSQASEGGRECSGTGQEGLSTFSQEQSSLDNQLREDNLSA